jgi:membrane associated rhomboid family serine protease
VLEHCKTLPDENEEAWVEVGRFAARGEAGEHALVLVAAGIDCQLTPRGSSIVLLVAESRIVEARRELAAYAEDSQSVATPRLPLPSLRDGLTGVLAYWCALTFIFSAASHHAFATDWLSVGEAQTGRIFDGEWWRVFTALGLHADLEHLISNLVAGSLFGFFLSEILGSGLAWLMILIAGGAGNAINASFQSTAHTSIGASTAIFGAIGLLAVLALKYQPLPWRRGLRRWVPLAAGIMLLAFLGIEGERIDVGAHLAGFLVGCLLGGVFLAVSPPVVTLRRTGAYAVGAVALFFGAWLIALFHGGA